MDFEQVDGIVNKLPGIPSAWGRRIYDFVMKERPSALLELGFWHGKSSCYIAAALHELGQGHLTTVDRASARENSPSIAETLERAGLSRLVTVHYEASSYTWFLKKELESSTRDAATVPKYDFVFIDGAHSWEVDALAFFLADKLLKQGGHMLFDDYAWTYGTSTALKNTEMVQRMPKDERDSAQVALIYELLVKQHPSYGNFVVDENNWAWARKLLEAEKAAVRTETRLVTPIDGLKRWLGR
jgi:predicted O-methyltransferase YrrM